MPYTEAKEHAPGACQLATVLQLLEDCRGND